MFSAVKKSYRRSEFGPVSWSPTNCELMRHVYVKFSVPGSTSVKLKDAQKQSEQLYRMNYFKSFSVLKPTTWSDDGV